jgi:hypothetical protein
LSLKRKRERENISPLQWLLCPCYDLYFLGKFLVNGQKSVCQAALSLEKACQAALPKSHHTKSFALEACLFLKCLEICTQKKNRFPLLGKRGLTVCAFLEQDSNPLSPLLTQILLSSSFFFFL